MAPAIKAALPQHITADRMTRIALTAVRQTPQLLNCDQMSLLGAIMTSAQLGLEPNTPLGEAYLIPYHDYKNKVTNAQFQIGYKGLLTLAYRTGQYRSIYAHEVYSNDKFHYEYGLKESLTHIPAPVPEGDPIYYYAVYHLANGGYSFSVWSYEKVKQHASIYSQSFSKSSSPWQANFDAMALKTVLKDVLKYAPKSIEFAHAIEDNDEHVKKVTETGDVVDITDFGQMNTEATEKRAQLTDQQGQEQNAQGPEPPKNDPESEDHQQMGFDAVADFENQEKKKK
jgi:recombination protein RecT